MSFSSSQPTAEQPSAENIHVGTLLLSADTITGDDVCNLKKEKLGKIHSIMFDMTEGKIRYIVLSSGGFLGMGDRYFAIPWKALTLDKDNKQFLLDVEVERLKGAPGFSKDEWPNMADTTWNSSVDSYFSK